MKYFGINPINVQGANFEIAYGHSNFITTKLNGNKGFPVLSAICNMWGIGFEERKSGKVFSSINERTDCFEINAKAGDVHPSNYVVGYPSFRIGESPWGPKNGFKFGKIKDYKKVEISVDWDFKFKGIANLSFDIWLTPKELGVPDKDSVEVMVWLDYASKPDWNNLGDFGPFQVMYKRKNKEWNEGGHVFAFFLKDKSRKNINFDLIDLMNYCKKTLKNVFNLNFRTIELGSEIFKNSESLAKIFKLNVNFVKK